MVHEPFVPVESWSTAVMTTWQRAQLWMLGQSADLLFFSIAPWAERFRRWFPETPVHHLPVSSNVPRTSTSRQAAREEIGLAADDFVIGVFGSAHPSRLLHFIRAAVARIRADVRDVRVLYIGGAGARCARRLAMRRLSMPGLSRRRTSRATLPRWTSTWRLSGKESPRGADPSWWGFSTASLPSARVAFTPMPCCLPKRARPSFLPRTTT